MAYRGAQRPAQLLEPPHKPGALAGYLSEKKRTP